MNDQILDTIEDIIISVSSIPCRDTATVTKWESVNFYVSIDKYIYGKVELLKCFESQISKYQTRGVDFIRKSTMINELNGYESKCQFAEGFAIDTYII